MILIHLKMKKLISAYLDNEVSSVEKNLVEEHLKTCTFCRRYYENLQRLSSTLDKYKEEELSPDLEQRIKNNFLGEKYKGVAKMKNKRLIVGISSGALAILVMFVFVGHMVSYLKSSVRGRLQAGSDEIGEQYSPGLYRDKKIDTDTNFLGNRGNKERTINQLGTIGKDGYGVQFKSHNFDIEKYASKRPLPSTGATLSASRHESYKQIADNEEAWLTTNGADRVDYVSGGEGVYSSPSQTPPDGLGPIVIVEPYLPATGREDKLIRNAEATLEVENIQKVYDEIVKIGKARNGYLAAADFNESANGRVNAQIILRVPKEKFEETIDEVRKLGQVKRFDIHSLDISQEYNALVSELNTVKTVYDKIAEKLKEKKTDIQASIRLESELTPIAKRIEAIRSKISEYDNLVSVSTITINLYEVSWKLMIQESVKETKQRFVAFVASLLKNSINLLPLLIIACVIGVIAIVAMRKLIRAVKKMFTKKSS